MAATGGSWDKGKVGVKGHFHESAARVAIREKKEKRQAEAKAAKKKEATESRRREQTKALMRKARSTGKSLKDVGEKLSKARKLGTITKYAEQHQALQRQNLGARAAVKDAIASMNRKSVPQAPTKSTAAPTKVKSTKVKSTGKKATTAKKKSTGGRKKKATGQMSMNLG